jgi:hypothetical protein
VDAALRIVRGAAPLLVHPGLEVFMRRSVAVATSAAIASLALSVLPASQASAQRCLSGSDVRGQVSTFVRGLHDEVKVKQIRQDVKGALVQSVKAARGAKADTPAESRGLGAEIRLLARQLKDAPGKVERAALIAEIQALQDQKKEARTTAADVQTLRTDVRKLGRVIAAKADTDAEGRQIAAYVHDLMAQFDS